MLARNVSIGLTRPTVVYKNPVRIFGSIPNEATGEAVTLHFAPYRKPVFTKTVVTEEGGYEFTYRPTIRTDVYATWKGTTSHASPTIAVRPLVIFRTLTRRRTATSSHTPRQTLRVTGAGAPSSWQLQSSRIS